MAEPTEENPSLFRKVFPWFLRFLRLIVVLALLLDGCSCGLVAKGSVDSNTLDDLSKAFGVLAQAGFMIIVIILLLAEFGLQWFIRVFYLFHFWAGRGLALGWLGIQAINSVEQLQAVMTTTQSTIDPHDVEIMGNVVGWTLISCGFLYVMMGMMCLQKFTGVASIEDLESGLLGGTGNGDSQPPPPAPGRETQPLNASSVSGDDEDAQLLINAAEALGLMNVRELRAKFGGRDGRRTAIGHYQLAQKQVEEMTALKGELRKLQQQQQKDAKAGNNNSKDVKPQQQQQQSNAAASASGSYAPPTSTPQSATAPPPSNANRVILEEDDDPRSRRMREDEELESQYYASQRGM